MKGNILWSGLQSDEFWSVSRSACLIPSMIDKVRSREIKGDLNSACERISDRYRIDR